MPKARREGEGRVLVAAKRRRRNVGGGEPAAAKHRGRNGGGETSAAKGPAPYEIYALNMNC